ncbi:MAG TPA: flagellar hook-basal body complex protein FliE [Rhizomicrobium sp.]|jgi:flagellar hook-basal body complex protein FliE|nr:flagellar hook-basal body complex protein FliE [Rhizomicrobium sp.]
MTIAPSAVTSAYQAMQKIGGASSGTSSGMGGIAGSNNSASFSDFLSGAMKSAVGNMQAGEQMATQQIAGKADVVDVVNAVNSAELTLNTVVAVRDKVVSAYQSIMNMPI